MGHTHRGSQRSIYNESENVIERNGVRVRGKKIPSFPFLTLGVRRGKNRDQEAIKGSERVKIIRKNVIHVNIGLEKLILKK